MVEMDQTYQTWIYSHLFEHTYMCINMMMFHTYWLVSSLNYHQPLSHFQRVFCFIICYQIFKAYLLILAV